MKPAFIINFTLIVIGFISCQNNKPSTPAENLSTDTSAITAPAPSPIFDITWKLVEVNGAAVSSSGDSTRQAHMVLNTTDSRVTGNGGCNSYSGQYTLGDDNKISFSAIVSTKMACDNLTTEGAFFKALESAVTYTVQNDTLVLGKADMSPLAKFVSMN